MSDEVSQVACCAPAAPRGPVPARTQALPVLVSAGCPEPARDQCPACSCCRGFPSDAAPFSKENLGT